MSLKFYPNPSILRVINKIPTFWPTVRLPDQALTLFTLSLAFSRSLTPAAAAA